MLKHHRECSRGVTLARGLKKDTMAIFSKLAEDIEEVDVIVAGGKIAPYSILLRLK